MAYLTSDKNVSSSNNAFLDFLSNCPSNRLLIIMGRCAIKMSVADVYGAFNRIVNLRLVGFL